MKTSIWIHVLALLLLLVMAPKIVQAADPQAPMDFTFKEDDLRLLGMGLRQVTYASGAITAGTTLRLSNFLALHPMIPGSKVTLDSIGGSLTEAIILGRFLRSFQFNTNIGTASSKGAREGDGNCYSSCTIAFMGGVRREIPSTSIFGVHRFYLPGNSLTGEAALDISQVQSGEVVDYLNAMGAKPGFVAEMNKASPQAMNILNQEQLHELNVITATQHTEWEIKVGPNGEIYVVGVTTDIRGAHKILFACTKDKKPVMMLMFETELATAKSEAAMVVSVSLRINGQFMEIPPSAMPSKVQTSRAYLTADVLLDKAMLDRIGHAKTLGFAMNHRSGITYFGFEGDFSAGRDKVFGVMKNCPK